MERGKHRTILASLAGGLWMLMVVGLSFAQEAQPAASRDAEACQSCGTGGTAHRSAGA